MNFPPYNTFPIVTSEKIVLREILDEDLKDIIEIQFYDAKQAQSEVEAAVMQDKINKDYEKGDSIHWAIVTIATNKIVGTLGYYRGFKDGVGELGCILLPEFRGKGFMTEAMKLAIDFGYNSVELNRVVAITSKDNLDALKLLNRLGFIATKEHNVNEITFEFPRIK